jgi:archaemetzincin
MPKPIHVIAVGENVTLNLLDRLAAALARVFQISCRVRTNRIDPEVAFDPARRQYHSTMLLQAMIPLAGGARLLGVTDYDLYVPILTYVFGEAQLQGNCALVSLHRLDDAFYGLPANEPVLFDRLLKEAVHELGHTFGLRHCDDWRCAMSSTHTVERLDLKQPQFCSTCLHFIG